MHEKKQTNNYLGMYLSFSRNKNHAIETTLTNFQLPIGYLSATYLLPIDYLSTTDLEVRYAIKVFSSLATA